ncbi:hypothetical protein TanjilG_28797 [Lupinus angustifolius]|uniref:GIR1-like zinc ribbon domain-containing protein n=2 Tax=Lupinus angustifolius TaxID=3871 RepID=A0A4P1R9L1_LUPAN|nr:hypothetical protein TanjilG_28797 [Lupinus angustifolius]
MATEVSSLIRVLGGGGGYKEEKNQHHHHHHRMVANESDDDKPTAPITMDLLGGSSIVSPELDLDSQVPNGWEKRLDLQTGKVHIQKCKTLDSPPMFENKLNMNQKVPKLETLNFPSSPFKTPLNLFDETSLGLNLFSPSLPSNNYQSVCTLDKVKSALERAEKEPRRKRVSFFKSSLSTTPSYSSSSSSLKETQEEECDMSSSPMAVGCPGCLSYVLIMKNNPKCPRCSNVVPLQSMKKPRIDLNISI